MMLSKSIKSTILLNTARSFSRLQSTAAASQVEEKVEPKKPRTEERPRNQLTSNLFGILNDNYNDFSEYFEKVRVAFENGSEKDKKNALNTMHALSSRMISKILDIKDANKAEVPNSIVFKEIVKLLVDNKILPAGTFNRYMKSLLAEKRYMAALTFWIENANYFKSTPNAFPKLRKKSEDGKIAILDQIDPVVERDYYLTGLVAYLSSLIESKDLTIDPEFIKLIFGDKKPINLYRFTNFVERLEMDKEDKKTIISLYSDLMKKSFDINATESLKGIRLAAIDGKLVYLNNAITNNLAEYKGKESEIKPETIAHYMKYLNVAKLYSRSIEIWRFASEHNIPMNISIWNQLLHAFAQLEIADSGKKVESVWNLLKRSTTPNSESYSTYVSFLMKSNQIEKIKELLDSLKKDSPELFDSSLKCSMIELLLASNKSAEALQLFKIYQKQPDFVPTLIVYNKLLSKLIASKNYDAAQELLNQLLSNKYSTLNPDTATWTIIVDFLLKTSAESNVSQDDIISNIFSIIKGMESSGVKLNNIALMTVASNLLKNNETHDLGIEFFQRMEKSGIKLNATAYTAIITAFGSRGDTTNAVEYYNKAIKNGILPSAFLYNSILKAYSLNPDTEATRKFMKEIKNMIQSDPNNQRLYMNKYTYYFLLLQGTRARDAGFVNEVLEDLSKNTDALSDALVRILGSLKNNGYTIPENLASMTKE
ncbi:hypothetical protein CANINC_003930 [Pichia inconspicua]|uniref:Mitochondrial 15S rRNA processing factor CCM1 n=1 Tax=Pichia inconspicua TaxID=52247 RepID=A0A4T0WXK9_9ASCO|nr:hypothetical protein CANINC_003930 [[Candida] inconspicua]